MFLFFIHIGLTGWSRAYLNVTGDPNALSRIVAGYINDNEVSVSIDGMWRISLMPAVAERFNVVAVMGDEMTVDEEIFFKVEEAKLLYNTSLENLLK